MEFQGSVIGPQAFNYYTRSVDHILQKHGLNVQCSDDVQSLHNQETPFLPSIRNLGVIFDYSMTMAEHITYLSSSIN